jgi:hypothetical protein
MLEFAVTSIGSSAPAGTKPRWVAAAQSQDAPEARFLFPHIDAAQPSNMPISDSTGRESTPISPVQFNVAFDDWTEVSEKRFRLLATSAALGSLTPEQAQSFKSLQDERRRLLNTRPPDEIIWEYKQNRATQNLINALSEYVELFNVAR